jgi:hypothetical protein
MVERLMEKMEKLRWLESIAVLVLAVAAICIASESRDIAKQAIHGFNATRDQMTEELNRAKKTYDEARSLIDGK